MTDENEYLDLPDDPEEAFAAFQRRRYRELEAYWREHEDSSWQKERQYVDHLIAFGEVYGLDIFSGYPRPPLPDREFGTYFQGFRSFAETASQKILMEAARRHKASSRSILVLDGTARKAIHHLLQSIRDRLNGLDLPETKRTSLFNKLNAFAAELDRNKTRTEAFFAFAIEVSRTAKTVNDEIKPLQQTIDRILDWLDKATDWKEALPPWGDRKKLDPPRKQLPKPDPGDDIPF